jgi:hypothetical protein
MTQSKWLRTEARTIRPFKYSEGLLDGISFRLSDKDDFTMEESLHKEEIALEDIMPEFLLDFDPSEINDELGLNADLIKIIVSVEDRLLKKRVMALDMWASQAVGERIVLSQEFCRQFSWSGSMRFIFSLILSEDRVAPLGEAARAGNWLAKKEFILSMGKDASIFRIEAVPPEFFEKFDLPQDTSYYVHILAEDFNHPIDDLSGLFTVYMNEAVSMMLSRTEESKPGQALARSVYADIAASILGTGFSYLSSEETVEEGGFLHTAVDRISKSTGIDQRIIVSMGREAGACRLRALLQSETGLMKALVSVTNRN